MHCVNCDRLLTDYEATRKHAITFKFLDLCKVCFDDVKTIIPTIDRRELMTEQDLDTDDDDDDRTMKTQGRPFFHGNHPIANDIHPDRQAEKN